MTELLQLIQKIKNKFPALRYLLSIVSVLPISFLSYERGFSFINIIKNKFRSSMENESSSDLMMINMNGPII